MENDLKGTENYFELTGATSYRGLVLPGVDCITENTNTMVRNGCFSSHMAH